MTVLHLISGGETGGSKNHLLTLLNEFPNGGVILGVMQEGQLAEEARLMGIRTQVFNQSSRYDLSIISKMKKFLQSENIELVHTHGPRANFFTFLLRKLTRFNWVTTIHSNPSKDFIKGGMKGKVFTALNMRVIRQIDHFFAVSHRFGEMLEGFGINSNKITIIYNGIPFDIIPEGTAVSRNEFGFSQSDFVVSMIARLHPIKNHRVAFEAVNQLLEKEIPVRLICIGNGPEEENLRELVHEMELDGHVHLAGFRKDIHQLLEAVDVNILTSDSESFPLVLLEAARAHTPVVTTDVGGVAKLIIDDSMGRVVPIGDANGVANGLEEIYLVKQAGELAEMGKSLYVHAKNNFSVRQLYDVTVATYSKIV